ncbi:MAG: type II toxin-antitoxin system death-on-curing family toxin [Methyloceanibacter sp.]|uniref:type II toxin-antitoxin system death-on-curing family toxin n=1 Tax=Methyloceanibacter sp. TaxID=1965321 RepID=UPI003D9B032B
MSEPVWLSTELILAIHDEQLEQFGGPSGLRDRGLLESALARPLNQYAYGNEDMAALAAAYAFGLVRNHPFIDGNKRTGLLAVVTFLGLNGIDFVAPEAETAITMLALASGEIDEGELAHWIREKIAAA